MHEYSICSDLVETAIEEASKVKPRAERIEKITISAGKLRQIVPQLMQSAFEALTVDTIAEGASLAIDTIEAVLICRDCGRKSGPLTDNNFHLCPFCNSINTEIIKGRELFIKSMEIQQNEQ